MTNSRSPASPESDRGALELLLERSTRRISLDALIESGRTEFRIVRRKDLLRELFDVVDAFVENKVKVAERQMANAVERRESEAREEGKLRVLASLADLGDLVDSVIVTLTDSSGNAATKALDKRLDRIFRSYEFDRIATVGKLFDPQFHEAIDEEPSSEHPNGTVVREVSRGYHRGAYVLRVARVSVSTGPQG